MWGEKRPSSPHRSISEKLIRMREESTDAVMNRYLDFFLFQTFTGMAYSNAKSFDYEQHIATIDGKDYIDGHRLKTGNDLPPTSRRRSGQDSFFFTYSYFRPTTRFYVSHQEKNFSSPDLFFSWASVFSHHVSKILTISRCQSTTLRQSDLG